MISLVLCRLYRVVAGSICSAILTGLSSRGNFPLLTRDYYPGKMDSLVRSKPSEEGIGGEQPSRSVCPLNRGSGHKSLMGV